MPSAFAGASVYTGRPLRGDPIARGRRGDGRASASTTIGAVVKKIIGCGTSVMRTRRGARRAVLLVVLALIASTFATGTNGARSGAVAREAGTYDERRVGTTATTTRDDVSSDDSRARRLETTVNADSDAKSSTATGEDEDEGAATGADASARDVSKIAQRGESAATGADAEDEDVVDAVATDSKDSKAKESSAAVAEIAVSKTDKANTTSKSKTSEPLGRGTVEKMMPVPIPKATRLRVLVTGGAGFVGSHLVDRLMERGNIVIVADNFFTGRKENIMQNPFFELIRHDVVEPMLVEVDQIYHLACPASPVHYKHNPVKTIKTSVMGTLNMLGLAKRVGARMLLTSTSEVYGDPLQHPQKESYWGNVNPIGVRSCYDEGKRVAETLCFDYHRQEGVDIRIARIFNTYGPRMALEDGRVVSNFVSQALRGEPLTVYGDGSQTRSFQYVDDLVAGLMALMDNEDEIGPVNIGNPGEFTMLELAEVVKEVVDKNAKIVYKENTADDPGRRQPDISLAKKALGWEPKITLKEGLPKMVEDFRERLSLTKTEL
jgi:UDP-glucuronate decarboxylase